MAEIPGVKDNIWKNRGKAFLLGLLFLGGLLAALELAADRLASLQSWRHGGRPRRASSEPAGECRAFCLAPEPPPPVRDYRGVEFARPWDLYLEHGELPPPRGAPAGHTSVREILKLRGGGTVYDATYVMDGFKRRITPGQDRKKAGRFLLLLGDSFIFGQGLQQQETLAARLAARLPGHRVYNYGISAAMPGQLLDRVRAISGPPEITERAGTVVYFMDRRQVPRNMGSLVTVGDWGWDKPYYFEAEDGRIVTRGTHAETRPLRTALARLWARSRLLRSLGLDWPAAPRRSDWLFQARLLQQIRESSARFGADRFLVVLYPNNEGLEIAAFLCDGGIPYLDLSRWRMGSLTRGPDLIPHDGHPTAEANEVLARELAPLLKKAEAADRPPAPLAGPRVTSPARSDK